MQLALLAQQIPGMSHHIETRKSIVICTREYVQQLQQREKRLRWQMMSYYSREKALNAALTRAGINPDDAVEEFGIRQLGPLELAQLSDAVERLMDDRDSESIRRRRSPFWDPTVRGNGYPSDPAIYPLAGHASEATAGNHLRTRSLNGVPTKMHRATAESHMYGTSDPAFGAGNGRSWQPNNSYSPDPFNAAGVPLGHELSLLDYRTLQNAQLLGGHYQEAGQTW
jgi:hypothetical protein